MGQAGERKAVLWAVICGGAIMGLALGIRHVQGLFLLPMTLDRGWSREAFAFAIAVQNLVWGIAQPFTGMVADRFGAARVLVAGTLLYAAGLVLMSLSLTPLHLALSAGVLIGIALACTAFGTVYGAISRLVDPAHRGWALGLTGAIGGIGQFVLVPAAQGLQQWLGWVLALAVLGGAIAALAPSAAALREKRPAERPAAPAQSMGQAIREAFGHRGFWLLNAGFLACGFQLAFIASHLPAYLQGKGLRPSVAVAGLAIIALTNIAGTYACGRLGDLYRRKYLLSGLYLARSAAMALFVLLPISPLTVYLFSAAMGLLWLGTVPLTNGLISQVFGVRYIATLFGFVFFGHQLGSFLGVWLGGYVFDLTKSYELVWLGAIGLGLLAATLHWPIDDREIARAGRLAVA
ncbi:MFS transporter [Variovorax sp. JS1663]|uniref:MFS transporter n=1 Tax=Variovorax sp. JS1663 TaxID=1851577 RepID=UPI000B349E4C|nr:MFS transporter [Variovorax sp. JS1663]OUL99059.1 MFS transporter [Variovorax sp. JS1663]